MALQLLVGADVPIRASLVMIVVLAVAGCRDGAAPSATVTSTAMGPTSVAPPAADDVAGGGADGGSPSEPGDASDLAPATLPDLARPSAPDLAPSPADLALSPLPDLQTPAAVDLALPAAPDLLLDTPRDLGAPADLALASPADLASASPADLAPTGAPFGAGCTVDEDCASRMCRSFRMMKTTLCTQPCALAGKPDPSCPSPPGDGTCTPRGYCRL